MTRLAHNFTLWEMTTTNHRAWRAHNYEDANRYLDSLRAVATMLQVVRDNYGAPVVVHSGYRCPQLNTMIGGSKTSQHMRGEAGDFHVIGHDLTKVFEWIWHESQLSWGQLLLEGWATGRPSWIHLSVGTPWRAAEKCGQVYTWDPTKGYVRLQ